MSPALRNFAAAGFKPRQTMRRILDAGRDRMIIPLVLLTGLSFIFGDADRTSFTSLEPDKRLKFTLIFAAAVVGGLLICLILFYLFSWAAYAIGRTMEGQGSARDVRSALAWGAVPFIWALLYRIPAVIWFPVTKTQVGTGGHTRFTFSPGMAGHGCMTAALLGILELTIVIWYVIVASNTIGEAHRFSSWRGLGTLLLTAITPLVLMIAAFLAS